MRRTSKASSVGSNSGREASRPSLRRSGALAGLLLAVGAAACLIPGSALAAETRPQIGTFGPDGTAATSFGFPGALAVDQGSHDIYVADYGSGKVEKFNENHAPSNFSALGSNEISGFSFSSGETLDELAVNSTSHAIYAADYGHGVIKAFKQNGEALNFTAGPGSGSNQLPDISELCGVAVDSNDDIYMGDYGAGIHVFKPDGEELTSFAASEPCNVAVDSSGAVYVSRYPFFSPGVEKFTPDVFPVTASTHYTSAGLVDPTPSYAIAVDPSNDDLYVTHSGNVSVYDSSGALRYEFAGGISSSEGIALDAGSGKAYASDGGSGKVRVFGAPVPLPSVTSEDADAIATTTATLHGTVNPEGTHLTDCHFEYVSDALFHAREVQSLTVSATGGTFSLSFEGQSTGAIPFNASADEVQAKLNALVAIGGGISVKGVGVAVSGGPGDGGGTHPYTITFVGALAYRDVEEIVADASSLTGGAASAQVLTTQQGEPESYEGAASVPCEPAAASIPPDSTSHPVSAHLAGLSPGTAYHFRILASTADGTVEGQDRGFSTAISAPTVSEQSAETIGATDAILSAKINPKGAPTTYHLEYGTTSSYGQRTPESPPIGFQGDASAHTVSVHIGGLVPGTAYHFRFVATSLAGETQGEDATFATYPASPSLGACPNEEFRSGFGQRLPDCRAYEQASPVDKHGAGIQSSAGAVQASSNGDRATFYLTGGLPSSGGSSTFSAFVASRGTESWSSDGLLPLLEPARIATIGGWSDDLSTTFDLVANAAGGETDFYLRHGAGSYQFLFSGPAGSEVPLDGYAADTEHLIFEVRFGAPLLPDAVVGNANLYDLDHGNLSLPGRIPVSPATSCDDEVGPACIPAPDGAFAGKAIQGFSGDQASNAHNAISRDGSKVYFTDRASHQIYLREDGTRTTQVSASQKTNGSGAGGVDPLGPQDASFREATPDGAQVFFTSPAELTNDADTGFGPGIARASLDGTGANYGFIGLPAAADGVAVDGSHLYWANPSANTIGRANLDGTGVEASFISGASKPQYVAVDGSHVYWTNAASGADGAGTIGRANLNGTGVEQSFITGASNPQGIAVDGSFVYWANAGSTEATRAVARANLDGTSPNQSFVAVGGESGPSGVAVNASFIYWGNPMNGNPDQVGGTIGRATIAGASVNQAFITEVSVPRGLAFDGSHLYWSNNSNFFGPTISRANLDGTEQDRTFIRTASVPKGLALDGSHIYWAGGDSRDSGNDLYRYDSATGDLTDLSVDSNAGDPSGANVQGFLGASPDGSYVYFVANGVLAPGAPQAGCVFGPSGNDICTTNLYVGHAGTTTFVAQLQVDHENDSHNLAVTSGKTSRVAADGTLVFSSERFVDLSGHDHGNRCGNSHENPCTEFYRYTPTDEGLTCITCIPTGPPSSEVELSTGTGIFLGQSPQATILTRNLSADGKRFFFETRDALVPADTNGVRDVYEWEAKGEGSCESESQDGGCIYLVSSGTSPAESHFLDASTSGDDVFFITEQQLVPGDSDALLDVYDASVDGGLASQHELTPPTCASTACQANPAPPADPSTASSSYRGAGNVHQPPSARKCPKGKRRVRRKGKVHCLKASKHHKRHSNRGGSK